MNMINSLQLYTSNRQQQQQQSNKINPLLILLIMIKAGSARDGLVPCGQRRATATQSHPRRLRTARPSQQQPQQQQEKGTHQQLPCYTFDSRTMGR